MLNTNIKLSNSTVMNQAVSGTLQKSHPKSLFKIFQNQSRMSELLFFKGTLTDEYNATKYIVLQAMLMNDNWLMIEIVDELLFIESTNP